MIVISYDDLTTWEKRFYDLAFVVAEWSKDPSSKVGATIAKKKKFISLGFNGPPSGVIDDPNIQRERKYKRTIHAELNAILFSRKKLKNCTLSVTHHPCSNCAATIIQKKIKTVICPLPSDDFYQRWESDIVEARTLFSEAGVELLCVKKTS